MTAARPSSSSAGSGWSLDKTLLVSIAVLLYYGVAACSAQPSTPSVSSVSGCQDVGNTTVNCNISSVITVTGSNFLNPAYQTAVLIGGDDYSCLSVDGQPPTNSSIVCSITSTLPPYWPGNVLLPLVVLWIPFGPQSAPFYGVTMFHTPLPQLFTISGCNDSLNSNGLFTRNCDPTSSVLTLTGQAFQLLASQSPVSVCLDGGCLGPAGGYGSDLVDAVNDTYLTFPLATVSTRLVEPDHYGGGPLNFSFTMSFWQTNALQLSIIPVPAPSIASISGCGPSQGGVSTTGCIPGVSVIQVSGQWFVQPLHVLVNGLQCALLAPIATTATTALRCLLPNFQPAAGVAYDVVVNTTVYADNSQVAVASGAVSFQTGPLLTYGVPCINNGLNSGIAGTYYGQVGFTPFMKCQPGATAMWTGFNLSVNPSQSAQLQLNFSDGSSLACNAVLINSSAVACTLPQLPSDQLTAATDWTTVQLQWSGGAVSNALSILPYENPVAPVVSMLTGCGVVNSTALALTGCLPGDAFTIYGSSFIPIGGLYVTSGIALQYLTTRLSGPGNSGSATVLVRQFSGGAAWPTNTPLPFTVFGQKYPGGWSNAFTVSMSGPIVSMGSSSSSSGAASLPATSSAASGGSQPLSSSSSSGPSAGAIAGIVIACVVVVAAAAICAVRQLQRRSEAKNGFRSQHDETVSTEMI